MPHVTFAPLRETHPDWFPVVKSATDLRTFLRDLCSRLSLVSVTIHPSSDDGPDDVTAAALSVIADDAYYAMHADIEKPITSRLGILATSPENSWLVERNVEDGGLALVQRGRDTFGNLFIFVICMAERVEDAVMLELSAVVQSLLGSPLSRICGLPVAAEAEPSHQLSARERECLTWTAEGKTSEEIAIILELSVHTVNHYLTSAARKLNAVNRLHAVARAMRLGLLKEVGTREAEQPARVLSRAHM